MPKDIEKEMKQDFEKIVRKLDENKQTISAMESCTGGGFAYMITNVPGASDVLKFSATTYSNEFKIIMGVPEEIIARFTVYSIETAMEMAKAISDFTKSDYAVGITGQLNCSDPENQTDNQNKVYISIYTRKDNSFNNGEISVYHEDREENKKEVLRKTSKMLIKTLI